MSDAIAVMVSGGPDSMILAAELAQTYRQVKPIYIRFGLRWESEEEGHVRRFLRAIDSPPLQSLQVFDLPMDGIYDCHWSVTGKSVPDQTTDDEAVLLPGRNLLLLMQPAIWCSLNHISAIALGILKQNPFSDASDDFFSSYERTIELAVSKRIELLRPYQNLSKIEVLRRGKNLPLQHTWSCIAPQHVLHCGHCNKCAERQRAFQRAEIPDPTEYAQCGSPMRMNADQ